MFILVFVLFARGSDELALQVVDVSIVVEQVLLVTTFDLNPAEPSLCKIFRVVDVDAVLFLFTLSFDLNFFAIFSKFLGVRLLLKSLDLTFRQVLKIDLICAFVCDNLIWLFVSSAFIAIQLIYLVL